MIKIRKLTKTYGHVNAVENINLTIDKKETFGFLGPNGAGKTTILSILSTLLKPTTGKITLADRDIRNSSNEIKKIMGVLFQETALDEQLTGIENLQMQSILYDIPKEKRKKRISEMIDFVGLGEWAQSHVEKYSGGMKRRLEIARALIHKPEILLLDEPTLGLDPTARETVWHHIEGLKNTTCIIATNYIEEAERLCDRIAIINAGKIVTSGTPKELKDSINTDFGELITMDTSNLISILEKLSFIKKIKLSGSKIHFSIEPGKRRELLDKMADYDLDSIEVRKATLNDVFFHYTGKTIEVAHPNQTGKKRRLGKRKMKQ